MTRIWGFLAGFLLVSAAACTSETTPPTPAPAPSTSSSKPTTTSPATTAPASPAKVTAACPFLPLNEVRQIIGDGIYGAKAGQQEGAVQKNADRTDYWCGYGGKDGLTLSIMPEEGWSIASMSAEAKKTCTATPMPLPGIGDDAWYCDITDDRVMTIVYKRSHGEIRFAGAKILGKTRTDVHQTIAKLLAERL